MFRPAIWMVAVTVQMVAARRAESALWEPRAFFRVTTGPRIVRSGSPGALLRRGPLRVKWAAGEVTQDEFLFRRPLPEPCLTLSRHTALQ